MDKYHDVHVTGNGIIGDNSTDPLAVKSRTVSTDEVSCVFALCISYVHRINIVNLTISIYINAHMPPSTSV